MTKTGAGHYLVAGAQKKENEVFMPKVLMKRSTMAAGQRVDAGQIVEIPAADARTLIALGKAVPVAEEAPKAENRDEEVTTTASKRAGAKKKETEG